MSRATDSQMAKMDFQPDLMFFEHAKIMLSIHDKIRSLMELSLTLDIIVSNGVRKTRWKLKLLNSSFIKNLMDSCRRLSMANMARLWLSNRPRMVMMMIIIMMMVVMMVVMMIIMMMMVMVVVVKATH